MGSGQKNINLYSGEFLYKCWKRFRKYGACLTGITQNFEECLKSDTARLMFANSEFVLMFNQASTDRKKLADVFESSETQMDYVNHSPVGHGLIKVGVSKEASAIIKRKYHRQKEERQPKKKDPVTYATDQVEQTGKQTATFAARQMKHAVIRHHRNKKHTQTSQNRKQTQKKHTSEPKLKYPVNHAPPS